MMLTHEERLKSYTHKYLRKLQGYTSQIDNEALPTMLSDETVLGCYQNVDNTSVFTTYTGLYMSEIERMMRYDEMLSCDIDLTKTTKFDVQKIQIYLNNGGQIDLSIIQPTGTGNGQTNEIWVFFTFLKNLIAKI